MNCMSAMVLMRWHRLPLLRSGWSSVNSFLVALPCCCGLEPFYASSPMESRCPNRRNQTRMMWVIIIKEKPYQNFEKLFKEVMPISSQSWLDFSLGTFAVHCTYSFSRVISRILNTVFQAYHRFCWYVTLENKTPAETFPKFPSVLLVIDISDRNPPITAH